MSGLRDYSVAYFGNDWFAENRTSSHHIARRLAQIVPVLYFETPGSRGPELSGRDVRKLWRKLARAIAAPQKVGEQLYIATIPQIPFRRLPMVDRVNRWLGGYLALRAMRQLDFGPRISWFVVPHPGPLAKQLGESLVVYYCIDDYASYPGMDPAAIEALDDHLTKKADVVFVAPRALLEPKRKLNPNVHFSPHGVDFELFSQASAADTQLPDEVRGMKHPVIGYFGTVGEFIDFNLLAFLAESRPGWTFLLIGLIAADVSQIRCYPNVIFMGPKPYETLPRWAAVFDVAIYAHLVNRQTRHSNPLKLREYLATGKPVVSVVTPETEAFADVVYLADNPGAYLGAIERALREETPQLRRQRMAAVKGQSWDARFEETVAVVDGMLTPGKDVS
jgi:glycosyltransferase involved in cell wall biosynthesis